MNNRTKEKGNNNLQRLGLGAAAVAATRVGSDSIYLRSREMYEKNKSPSSKKDLEDFLDRVGKRKGPNNFELTAKDGRKISVDTGYKKSSGGVFARKKNPKRLDGGKILLGEGALNPTTFFHELGHGTGTVIPRHSKKTRGRIRKGTAGAAALASLLTRNPKTEEEAKRNDMVANAILGVGALNEVPNLSEEARASLRGLGLAKKLGYKGKLNKKQLLGAFGTYGATALGSLSLPIASKILASRDRKKLREKMIGKTMTEHTLTKHAQVAVKRDPAKWARAKAQAKAKMGGKHSARAMQLATQIYKKSGGTYAGKKPSASSNKLKKWGKQKWRTRPGTSSIAKKSDGSTSRYLPEKKWRSMSKDDQLATDIKKRSARTQYIANTARARVKSKAKYY